jgi:indolepyruvate ferredoxin oxidoreductase
MKIESDTSIVDLDYRLTDAITQPEGRIFASGTQCLVRLLVMQRLADRRVGLRTAGFVSGYRGSPLAGLDTELWRSKAALADHDIKFLPAINEDLAATAVSGTQNAGSDPYRTVDGVFALWYGKGPGVDRAGDAIRHGNAAGTSSRGGVILAVGDDHAATSSSIPNASDLSLKGWGIPIVHPSSVSEYVDFGLWSWAASRYSGSWIALKTISETVESSRSFSAVSPPTFVIPAEPDISGLGYSTSDFLMPAIETRIARRLEAVAAFARANPPGRISTGAGDADTGIVVAGKNAADAMEVFERVGLFSGRLTESGVRIWCPGLLYPLDVAAFEHFARGLKHILVIEEKTDLVEAQIKERLYNRPADTRPSVCGRHDLEGAPLIPSLGQHRPSSLAAPISRWLSVVRPDLAFEDRVGGFAQPDSLSNGADEMRRLPYFCSGCPHNSSTKVPAGSIALAGVGCHFMASWMERSTSGLTQMGGEGADWAGQAAFTERKHVFQNMGEGTYFHSGYLAIRQAVAAKANITYKILFNDAVAMTGGQPVDGQLTVPQIASQMTSEGASKVVVVTDEPRRYSGLRLTPGVEVHDRRDLDAVQRQLREIEGVTVLIYDQTCAAEKRRRRKRGSFPDPDRRMFINSAVCEGCGDCGHASNCLSIVPLETSLGRKRAIDQSSCNKDYSCAEGFCPSFVSVIGGRLKKVTQTEDWEALGRELPEPIFPAPGERPYNLLIAGVGGTGIITAGAIIAMAAHLEGKEVSELDFTALAQKGGSVMCHLRVAPAGTKINQPRIDWGEADAVIVSDLIVGCLPGCLGTIRQGATGVLVNTHVSSIAEFTRNPDAGIRLTELMEKVEYAAASGRAKLDANQAAADNFGDSQFANMILTGHAWQQGLIPVSQAALLQAIVLNGVAAGLNKQAFYCGRVLAARGAAGKGQQSHAGPVPPSLDALIEERAHELGNYQNEAYAKRYKDFVEACRSAGQAKAGAPGSDFTRAVAEGLFKLMAYKDEYEVARLYTRPEFAAELNRQFEGPFKLRYHLAPPLLARPRRGQTVPQKVTIGPWMMHLFHLLVRLKFLRGTRFDPFSYMAERRIERRLIEDYMRTMRAVASDLTRENLRLAVSLAEIPKAIRGFGHIKRASIENARHLESQLLEEYRQLKAADALPAEAAA